MNESCINCEYYNISKPNNSDELDVYIDSCELLYIETRERSLENFKCDFFKIKKENKNMDKLALNKHWAVMSWYKNSNVESVYKVVDGKIVSYYNPEWGIDETYIINDEFISFRIGIYKGKTLQYHNGATWIDVKNHDDHNREFKGELSDYRIKEDIKFVIGEYITHANYAQVMQIINVNHNNRTVCVPLGVAEVWFDYTSVDKYIFNKQTLYAMRETLNSVFVLTKLKDFTIIKDVMYYIDIAGNKYMQVNQIDTSYVNKKIKSLCADNTISMTSDNETTGQGIFFDDLFYLLDQV